MKIVSLFVCPMKRGRHAVVTTVQHKDGRLSSYALDPDVESNQEATLFARDVSSVLESSTTPLEFMFTGGAGPGPVVGGGGPHGPGGDGLIPEAVAQASRRFFESFVKLSRELATPGGAEVSRH